MKSLKKNFRFKDILLLNFINLTNKDKQLVRGWRNNKDIRKWMYSENTISPKEHSNFIKKLKVDNQNFYWLAKNKDDKYLGVIYLNRLDNKNKNVYLGIYVNPNLKIRGIGHLLMTSLKRIAFKIIGLHSLKLEVIDINHQAINFYRKEGFLKEGKLREFVFKDKKWHDVVIMGIINVK